MIDQKPSTGGVSPFAKWMMYVFDPTSGAPSLSTFVLG